MADRTHSSDLEATGAPAEIEREYGPFPDVPQVHGVSFDGERVWFASGEKLYALDPATGERVRTLEVRCDAGTAFDGKHLYQLAAGRIQKIDPETGALVKTIAAPEPAEDSAGLTWAEGTLWIAQYRNRRILQVDPETGEVLRTLQSDRFVTGVTFAGDELWHGTLEDDVSELREIDAGSGRVRARVRMPAGSVITGLESDGRDRLYAGGGKTGVVRALRKPRRRA